MPLLSSWHDRTSNPNGCKLCCMASRSSSHLSSCPKCSAKCLYMVCALVHGIHRCDSKHWTSACCSVFRSCISRRVSQRRAEVGPRHSALVTALNPPPTCYTPPSPAQSGDSSVDLRHRLGGQTKRTCAWSNDRDTPHSTLTHSHVPTLSADPIFWRKPLSPTQGIVSAEVCRAIPHVQPLRQNKSSAWTG